MTAVAVDDIKVETIQCRNGTVVFTELPDTYEITGTHRTRTVNGNPARFVYRITRCHCRTDPASPNLQAAGHRYSPYTNTGMRPLCPHPPNHDTDWRGRSRGCHNKKDHCASRGHESTVREVLAGVVKSYGPPAKVGPDQALRQLAPSRRITAGDVERKDYVAWLRKNDPEAVNPYPDSDKEARIANRDAARAAGHSIRSTRSGKRVTLRCDCGANPAEFATYAAANKWAYKHIKAVLAEAETAAS